MRLKGDDVLITSLQSAKLTFGAVVAKQRGELLSEPPCDINKRLRDAWSRPLKIPGLID